MATIQTFRFEFPTDVNVRFASWVLPFEKYAGRLSGWMAFLRGRVSRKDLRAGWRAAWVSDFIANHGTRIVAVERKGGNPPGAVFLHGAREVEGSCRFA